MISRLKIEIINVDAEVARKYALIYLFLEKKGAKIPAPLPGLRPEEVAPSGQP